MHRGMFNLGTVRKGLECRSSTLFRSGHFFGQQKTQRDEGPELARRKRADVMRDNEPTVKMFTGCLLMDS